MLEATERLASRDHDGSSRTVRFSYSRPEQRWLNRTVIQAIERISGQPKLERLYRHWSRNPPAGENIFSAGVRLLGIRIETDDRLWQRVPRDGPVLFIANHPYGVIDGLILGHLATRARPDTRIMTHSLLCQPPEARDYLLPVDFGGTPEARQTSLLTRRRSIDWLQSGHAVAVFPAGSVATAQKPLSGPALDPPWHPFVARLARVPGLHIVPVCFHGQNSRLFQLASHTHYALRIALLFRETARLTGRTIRVSVGEPFAADSLADAGSRETFMRELRVRTLSLAGPAGPDPLAEFRWPEHITWD